MRRSGGNLPHTGTNTQEFRGPSHKAGAGYSLDRSSRGQLPPQTLSRAREESRARSPPTPAAPTRSLCARPPPQAGEVQTQRSHPSIKIKQFSLPLFTGLTWTGRLEGGGNRRLTGEGGGCVGECRRGAIHCTRWPCGSSVSRCPPPRDVRAHVGALRAERSYGCADHIHPQRLPPRGGGGRPRRLRRGLEPGGNTSCAPDQWPP